MVFVVAARKLILLGSNDGFPKGKINHAFFPPRVRPGENLEMRGISLCHSVEGHLS